VPPRPDDARSKQSALLVPGDVAADLPRLQESYQEKTGTGFEHYFCPFLHNDEPAQLCMGHIVPESYASSCRTRVAQRADVDNFYGAVAEGHFGTLLEAKSRDFVDLLLDKKLSKEMRPQFVVNGQQVEYYPYRGKMDPAHTRVLMQSEHDGRSIDLVFKMPPEEMHAAIEKDWGTVVERDCRLSAIVTLIKAAYLTLFNMNGYQWALSAGGVNVGYDILGRFYRENRGKHVTQVREAMKPFFEPYKHMVRPVGSAVGDVPMRGTLEDNRVSICELAPGRPFALIVFVRIDDGLHAVLMPVYQDVATAVAYHAFLNNERESVSFAHGMYDSVNRCWGRDKATYTASWPKTGETFDLA
jgi:hypothetical protein